MSEYEIEVPGDPEWVAELNEKLPHGHKKVLAKKIRVHPSTVTRMCQGKPVRSGALYRASLEMGMRQPTTLPPDKLQQRVLMALVDLRRWATPEQVEAVVSRFETVAQDVASAWDSYMQKVHRDSTPEHEFKEKTLVRGMHEVFERLSKATGASPDMGSLAKIFERSLLEDFEMEGDEE